jgi:probable rRNA maturation factor
MAIQIFTEDVLKPKIKKKKTIEWLKGCIVKYKKEVGNINYIFCSDEYLRSINVNYLGHDYYTDIITFNYNSENKISGDIFISVERVEDNAIKYKVGTTEELLRVMIHGILHLVGFNDKGAKEKKLMREEESKYIKSYN